MATGVQAPAGGPLPSRLYPLGDARERGRALGHDVALEADHLHAGHGHPLILPLIAIVALCAAMSKPDVGAAREEGPKGIAAPAV